MTMRSHSDVEVRSRRIIHKKCVRSPGVSSSSSSPSAPAGGFLPFLNELDTHSSTRSLDAGGGGGYRHDRHTLGLPNGWWNGRKERGGGAACTVTSCTHNPQHTACRGNIQRIWVTQRDSMQGGPRCQLPPCCILSFTGALDTCPFQHPCRLACHIEPAQPGQDYNI